MHTHNMLVFVQCCLMAASTEFRSELYQRLTRIEAYLIERYTRD